MDRGERVIQICVETLVLYKLVGRCIFLSSFDVPLHTSMFDNLFRYAEFEYNPGE